VDLQIANHPLHFKVATNPQYSGSNNFVHERFQLIVVLEAHEPVNDLAPLDPHHRRHSLHFEGHRQVAVFVNVHFSHDHFALVLADEVLQLGTQEFAGATPGGVKVYDDRQRRVHDAAAEIVFVLNINDVPLDRRYTKISETTDRL